MVLNKSSDNMKTKKEKRKYLENLCIIVFGFLGFVFGVFIITTIIEIIDKYNSVRCVS